MKLRSYILLAILVSLICIVAFFPANLAWRAVPAAAKANLGVNVQQVGGTLWNGFIEVNNPRPPLNGPMVVEWDLHPLALLGLNLASTLKVKANGLDLGGRLHVGLGGYGVEGLTGEISATLLNRALAQQGVTASGELLVQGLELVVSGNQVGSAAGQLNWGGGPVTYRQGSIRENLNFPAIRGQLKEDQGGVVLNVVETQQGQALADLSITADTIGGVKVYQRVLRLAGFGGSGSDDKPVVSLQQPLSFTWEKPLP